MLTRPSSYGAWRRRCRHDHEVRGLIKRSFPGSEDAPCRCGSSPTDNQHAPIVRGSSSPIWVIASGWTQPSHGSRPVCPPYGRRGSGATRLSTADGHASARPRSRCSKTPERAKEGQWCEKRLLVAALVARPYVFVATAVACVPEGSARTASNPRATHIVTGWLVIELVAPPVASQAHRTRAAGSVVVVISAAGR